LISLIQTAEGALNETHSILQRMRELAVQSSNDTNTDIDRGAIQEEINQLAEEITRIADTTEFNTQNLLGGEFSGKFHIGANEGQNINVEINDMSAQALGVSGNGEGVALTEISNTVSGTTELDLTEGDHTLTVVDFGDNLSVAGETDIKYGLQNEAGEIVAIGASDGKTFQALDNATSRNDLSTLVAGDLQGESINFAESVRSGEVEVTVGSNGSVAAGDATATASIEVDGLETGTYTAVAVDNDNFDDYFADGGGDGKIDIGDGANPLEQGDISSVLLDSEGAVVAVEFSDDGSHTAENQYFKAEDLDFDVDSGTAQGRIDAIVDGDVEALFTSGVQIHGQTIEVKADGGIDVSSQEAADAAITTINNAIETVSAERSKIGAVQNRLDHTINNLGTSAENLTAAESRIRDVDYAEAA
jgi:flagellin